MRSVLLVPALFALAACQSPDPTAYHHAAAHPIELRETVVRMMLGAEPDLSVTRARQFAAQRPNNGSSFVVAAEPALAEAVRTAIVSAGVDPRDVQLVPLVGSADVARTDRFASVANCQAEPTRLSPLYSLTHVEDGLSHSNANSTLLGCAVRRNAVQMADDPRTLMGPVVGDGRDGARSAEVYQKWVKGQPTYSGAQLPSWSTSSATSGTGQ